MASVSKQETFDAVARHLHAQGEKAVDAYGDCQYRTGSGLRCAVGALIPDDAYSVEMEENGIRSEYFRNTRLGAELNVTERLMSELGHDLSLLHSLQTMHDFAEVTEWPDRLRSIAYIHDVNSAVVDELWGTGGTDARP